MMPLRLLHPIEDEIAVAGRNVAKDLEAGVGHAAL
jgi:hypothetical protein